MSTYFVSSFMITNMHTLISFNRALKFYGINIFNLICKSEKINLVKR